MPLIIPANSLASGGYEVANSLRFNSGSSDYLNRTPSGASSTKTKFTYNCWVKRSKLGTEQNLIEAGTSSNERTYLSLGVFGTDELSFVHRTSGSNAIVVTGTNLLRDVSAWYMITLKYDSTDGTANNRVRLFINNVEVAYTTQTMPSSNATTYINNNTAHFISKASHAGERYLDGYLSEVVMVDATALNPDSFSEVDEDSGILKPISVSGLTFGTNGFYLDFEDSSALGNDAAGSNNFTVNNLTAVDQSTDTCTNNFATMNPLDNFYASSTFLEGNLQIQTQTSSYTWNTGTFGLSKGKWFWEVKYIARSVAADYQTIGIAERPSISAAHALGIQTDIENGGYYAAGNTLWKNTNASYGDAYTINDIIGVALNIDDNELKFYKNGTVQNSGTALAIGAISDTDTGFYFPAFGDYASDSNITNSVNFGSPAYAISSGNADGNGYGNFEYAVPSGFYAICTKNLSEFG